MNWKLVLLMLVVLKVGLMKTITFLCFQKDTDNGFLFPEIEYLPYDIRSRPFECFYNCECKHETEIDEQFIQDVGQEWARVVMDCRNKMETLCFEALQVLIPKKIGETKSVINAFPGM